MKTIVTLAVLLLGAASFYLEQLSSFPYAQLTGRIIDLLIIITALSDFFFSLIKAKYKRIYLSHNLIASLLLIFYIILFISDKFLLYYTGQTVFSGIAAIIILRNTLILFRVFSRFGKLSSFMQIGRASCRERV